MSKKSLETLLTSIHTIFYRMGKNKKSPDFDAIIFDMYMAALLPQIRDIQNANTAHQHAYKNHLRHVQRANAIRATQINKTYIKHK